MKAFILAAGFGTRLSPFTKHIPKPLFTLNNLPVLAHTIRALEKAGCDEILINTHHLHEQVDNFLKNYSVQSSVETIYEPEILDTGGAIANAKPFFGSSPFFVINADIISSIDLKKIYKAHLESDSIATLVLHDFKEFNKIKVDKKYYIRSFDHRDNALAFTGIQVLSPEIFDYFPEEIIFSSIDIYKKLCPLKKIKAFVEKKPFWSDIGTCSSYVRTSCQMAAASAFKIPNRYIPSIEIKPLSGDGSDRKWYRASFNRKTCILCDHGINLPGTDQRKEFLSFVKIGNHCWSKNLNFPEILGYDSLSGVVAIEDLGDVHLQTFVTNKKNDSEITKQYEKIIDHLILFSQTGIQGFKPDWTYQTDSYSEELIINKECLYFINSFIQDYLGKQIEINNLMPEFELIARNAIEYGYPGLMHRDFQSKNIMIRNNQPYFIDFQSARKGPLQYDLASILIDPYVNLNPEIRRQLLEYTLKRLKIVNGSEREQFLTSFNYCCLTRNLQMLGAFAFLSRVKKKTKFEKYIPDAVDSLKRTIQDLQTREIQHLSYLIESI